MPNVLRNRSHFHHGYDAPPQPCTNCAIQQVDYDQNVGRVQTCDLGGLPDLDTGNTHVQQVSCHALRYDCMRNLT